MEAPADEQFAHQNNITLDATYRTEQLAETMRNSTNQITIYTIGLGNKINVGYMQNLANINGVADSSEPQGDYEYAPARRRQHCQHELDNVFRYYRGEDSSAAYEIEGPHSYRSKHPVRLRQGEDAA